jgi:hypothetical protein
LIEREAICFSKILASVGKGFIKKGYKKGIPTKNPINETNTIIPVLSLLLKLK